MMLNAKRLQQHQQTTMKRFRCVLIGVEVSWILATALVLGVDPGLFSLLLIVYIIALVATFLYGFKRLGHFLITFGEEGMKMFTEQPTGQTARKRRLTDVWYVHNAEANDGEPIVGDREEQDVTEGDTAVSGRGGSAKKRRRRRPSRVPSGVPSRNPSADDSMPRRGSYTVYEQARLEKMKRYLAVRKNIRNTTIKVILGCSVITAAGLSYGVLTILAPWQEYSEPGVLSLPMILFEMIPIGVLINLLLSIVLHTIQ